MADPNDDEPSLPSRFENRERDPLVIPDEAAAEIGSEDLAERTAKLPDPDPESRWWAWWREQGQSGLTRLLRAEWNPIDADAGDVADDEYASYATRLGDLLREGIPEDEIAAFLSDARTGALGLPAEPEADERVAALVHAWYRTAHHAAD